MKSIITLVLLALACPALSEVLHLQCATDNPLADNRVYIIDTATGAGSVHYDYGFMLPASKVSLEAGVYTLYFASGGGLPEVTISRVTGKYRTKFEDEDDTGTCELLEDSNFKF